MEPSNNRPAKRRRKVGRVLSEDDPDTADAVLIRSKIVDSEKGEVERTWEEPVWTNRKVDKPSVSSNTLSGNSKGPTSDGNPPEMDGNYSPFHDPHPDLDEPRARTQNDYIEEFVDRIHPMLNALLSREAIPRKTICERCTKIGKWRCRDCSLGRVLCRGCMRDQHMHSPLHRIEEWNGSYFHPAELWQVGAYMLILHHEGPHRCATIKFQEDNLAKFQQHRDNVEQERLNTPHADEEELPSDTGLGGDMHTFDTPINIDRPSDMLPPSELDGDIEADRLMDNLYQQKFVHVSRSPDHVSADISRGFDTEIPSFDDSTHATEPDMVNIPKTDAFNNRFVRIVHHNGIHHMALVFCGCRGGETTHCDLMAAGVVPASFKRYQTLFTHAVLDDFRLTNLECKASAYQYFQKLCRKTSPMSPESVPNLYHEFRRMSRIWRWMKKLKWAGVAHRPEETDIKPGELANFCPACPQPGVNLPDDWMDDSQKWVYRRFFVADGNFKADHVRQKNPENDVWLSEGGGMTAKRDKYEDFLRNAKVISAKPPCKNNFRAIELGMLQSKACDIRGIVAIACARHGCFAPNSVSNLPRGEKQENVDWGLLQSIHTTHVDKRQGMMLIYDIVCQYIIYLWMRIGHLLPADMIVDAAIGLFHVHGHQDSCFFRYATSFIPGSGVVAGEILESLWSVLNAVTPAMRTASLAHRAELMDDHMTDSNHKKALGMTAGLIDRHNQAISTHESARLYYEALIPEITHQDLSEWEEGILYAEGRRLKDISVMDVLGSKGPTITEESVPKDSQAHGPIAEWMQMALQIEEKQIDIQDRVRRLPSEPSEEGEKEVEKLRQSLSAQIDVLESHQHRLIPSVPAINRQARTSVDETFFDDLDMPAEIRKLLAADGSEASGFPNPIPVDNSATEQESDVVHPERRQLSIPSRWASADEKSRSVELCQRILQAARTLEHIRDLIADKSFQFSHVIRVAPNKGVRTRARHHIAKLNHRISYHCRVYSLCRTALDTLNAGDDILNKFRVLRREDLGSSSALINPNQPGSTKLRLSWIWQTPLNAGNPTSGALREFNRVHWLRARALRDRWKEEITIVEYEMGWTVNYYLHQAKMWKDRGKFAEERKNGGAAAYASRKMATFLDIASSAERRFRVVNPNFTRRFK